MNVPRSEIVITEGEVPDYVYIVRSGHLSVTKHGEQGATLGPDDWFGEIGLLQRVPRTATVRTINETELWQIQGAEFLAALNESALPAAALLEGMSHDSPNSTTSNPSPTTCPRHRRRTSPPQPKQARRTAPNTNKYAKTDDSTETSNSRRHLSIELPEPPLSPPNDCPTHTVPSSEPQP